MGSTGASVLEILRNANASIDGFGSTRSVTLRNFGLSFYRQGVRTGVSWRPRGVGLVMALIVIAVYRWQPYSCSWRLFRPWGPMDRPVLPRKGGSTLELVAGGSCGCGPRGWASLPVGLPCRGMSVTGAVEMMREPPGWHHTSVQTGSGLRRSHCRNAKSLASMMS